jgi:hypothetical protein
MKTLVTVLASALISLSFGSSAQAGPLRISVACPASEAAGNFLDIDVEFENRACSPASARLITSIAGNPSDSVGALGVYGPKLVQSGVAVPAATENSPGGCFFGNVTPGITNVATSALPALPAALVGTVATYVIVAEWNGGNVITVKECLVDVTP